MKRSGGPCAGRIHRLVRVVACTVLATGTAALIATQPWHEDRPLRFVAVSGILLIVLAVHLGVVVQLTSRSMWVAPVTLLAAAASAALATVAWLVPHLVGSGLPAQAESSLVAVEIAAVAAGVVALVRTRDLGQAALAALWSSALSAFLVFVGSLLAFVFIPASVPDTQGRAMLPTATAAQRLAENRIDAPDGYLGLLALTCLLALVVWAALPMATRRVPVGRPAAGFSRTPG